MTKAIVGSPVEVAVVVVLDSCTDNTLRIVQALGVDYLTVDAHRVGAARRVGVDYLINKGCDWICTTDADSMVTVNWLQHQVTLIDTHKADMICGGVHAIFDEPLHEETQAHYEKLITQSVSQHRVYGANLSFSAKAYLSVDGFNNVAFNEDVSLVNKFKKAGHRVIWSGEVMVHTSFRKNSRAPVGLGAGVRSRDSHNQL
jgi:cellulose synthase/poly-beta-1,6-N-acetylglucosamine synthase-like glycosyltransferase